MDEVVLKILIAPTDILIVALPPKARLKVEESTQLREQYSTRCIISKDVKTRADLCSNIIRCSIPYAVKQFIEPKIRDVEHAPHAHRGEMFRNGTRIRPCSDDDERILLYGNVCGRQTGKPGDLRPPSYRSGINKGFRPSAVGTQKQRHPHPQFPCPPDVGFLSL